MHSYSFVQWLLLFYIYCMLGWLWESCYVSVLDRKWVNRGFLNGPFLPIYGFGAVIILLSTLPVKNSLVLVFFFGMAGATLLEYFTGFFMEKLFRVRYWDYSDKPLNLNGYICLPSSLVWGGFSILLVKVLHQPVEGLVMLIPGTVAEILAFILTVAIAVDITESFRDAMDLKAILIRLKESAAEIKRIEKRLDVIVAFLDNDIRVWREKAEENLKALEARLSENKNKYEALLSELKERVGEKIPGRELLTAKLEHLKKVKSVNLSLLFDNINTYLESISRYAFGIDGDKTDEYDKICSELNEYKECIRKQELDLAESRKKELLHSLRLLRRNPGASSGDYAEALAEVKELNKKQ